MAVPESVGTPRWNVLLVSFVACCWVIRSSVATDDSLHQDLLDLKLLGLRLEFKMTILQSLVNKVNAQANKCNEGQAGGGARMTESEGGPSDIQERILRAQQAIIDISNRNTGELENLSHLVVTQTSKLANRSEAMLGILKSSRQQEPQSIAQGRRQATVEKRVP